MFRIRGRRRLPARLRRRWAAVRLGREKARHRRGRPLPENKSVVFLAGCQRSGTDMSLEVLKRCLDTDAYNEDHPAAFVRCRIRSRSTVLDLIDKSPAPDVLFKPICDSHRLADLLGWHAASRAVWLYRDYRDVANSSVVRWGDFNRLHLQHLLKGAGEWGWSQWNRDAYPDDALAEIADLVDDNLTPHGGAALYWYLANRAYFAQGLDGREDVTIFRYRDLVTKPRETFGRMCAFVAIEFTEPMAAAVHARSLRKGRAVPLDPRIDDLCSALLARMDADVERRRGGHA